MKKALIILAVFFFNNSYSQNSWTKIYQPTSWQIESFYKLHHSDNTNSIYIRHNTNDTLLNSENGALKKYSSYNNSWTVPGNGFLNTNCGTCVDPPSVYNVCCAVSFFMISPADSNFMMKYAITLCTSDPDANTYFSHNSGSNWVNYGYLFGCGGAMFYPNGGDIDPNNDNICYYGYPSYIFNNVSTIFKSTNKGVNWFATVTIPYLRITGNAFSGLPGGFIKINPFNTNYIFAAHEDYMMLSTDAGNSFNSINIPPLKELSFDYTAHIIYGISQNKIYKSLNNGLNWDSSVVIFNPNTLEVSPDSSNVLYVGSSNGLYRSSNSGQNWYLYNNTFSPSKNIIGLSKSPVSGDTIFVCTKDAVYKVFHDELVGVNQNISAVPSSFRLFQNYPNPFNPNTIISYEIPENSQGNVKLIVYNILGTEIATLVNDQQPAGKYSVEFNGSLLSSGIYYYKIEMNNIFEVRKMTLLK